VVSPDKGIWHCFGACGEGGDVFSFIEKVEGLEFADALKMLAERAGVELKKSTVSKQSQSRRQRLYELLELASRFYHEILMNQKIGKQARDYLKERGVLPATQQKFQIGAVPYLNALPLTHYLESPIQFATPAVLESKIADGLLDIALLPAFSYLNNSNYYPLMDAGVIQSTGPVESVCLFIKDGITGPEAVKSIYLTPESRTSVALFKVLFHYLWERDLDQIKIESDADDADAQLIIGDKALFFNQPGYQITDLGKVWQDWTGLPFVYAFWVARSEKACEVGKDLKKARIQGLKHIDEIIQRLHDLPKDAMKRYLTESIGYEMKENSLDGLKLFQDYCFKLGLLKEKRDL